MAVVAVEQQLGPPRRRVRREGQHHLQSLAFLVPGAVLLLAIVIWPAIATIRYSFYNGTATKAVGFSNYKSLFSTADTLIAFRNNVIWVLVFPFIVTVFGLVFAVLSEHIRWSTAFKTIIFLPIVFSVTASSLVFTQIFQLDPHVGVLNALVQTVDDYFHPPGAYPLSSGQTAASLATSGVVAGPHGTLESSTAVRAGSTVRIGLTGVNPDTLTVLGARQARLPAPSPGAVTGLVWRDFSASNPSNISGVLPGEDGFPNLHLALLASDGSIITTTTTDAFGRFVFPHVGTGPFRVQIEASNFTPSFSGTFWLGPQSLTPTSNLSQTAQALLSVPLIDISEILAYLWIWAGFTMVVVAAGLAALDREALEAAHVDGATEWQTFRRITIPMLAPVLTVVFVTMVINVLKIFDIVVNLGVDTSQPGGQSSTLASDVYYLGFGGGVHTGLASALAVILFILVVPAMLFNLKRISGK
ncbi:MAG: ABC transporter permease subunit [Acidimicrobiales bacterium]|jgi:alpha-glucoside transport system permease protein